MKETQADVKEAEYETLEQSPMAVGLLESQIRGEIDVQIATAKRWPRSIKKFRETATEMATLDEETAVSCIYALPRDGKVIEGPSARLAEIIVSAWGNSRAGARTVSDEGNFVIAQGAFHDLERNVAINFEVRRRITNKKGRRYSDDMIGTTANAACSIALRNAVLKGVPKAFWQPIYDAAKKAAIGDAKTLSSRRATMLDYFQKMGVFPDRVYKLLEVAGLEEITLEHLGTLKGVATAIKDGETTVDQAFAVEEDEKKPPGEKTKLRAKEQEQAAAEKDDLQPAKTAEGTGTKETADEMQTPVKSGTTDKAAVPTGVPHGPQCGAAWEAIQKLEKAHGVDLILDCRQAAGYGETTMSQMSLQQLETLADEVRKAVLRRATDKAQKRVTTVAPREPAEMPDSSGLMF